MPEGAPSLYKSGEKMGKMAGKAMGGMMKKAMKPMKGMKKMSKAKYKYNAN